MWWDTAAVNCCFDKCCGLLKSLWLSYKLVCAVAKLHECKGLHYRVIYVLQEAALFKDQREIHSILIIMMLSKLIWFSLRVGYNVTNLPRVYQFKLSHINIVIRFQIKRWTQIKRHQAGTWNEQRRALITKSLL